MPPASVTIAAARRMSGTQSGEVMCVTSTSPACKRAASASEPMMRTVPLPLPGAAPRPRTKGHARATRLPARCAFVCRQVADRCDRARLQHPDLGARVERPFGVLRSAVVAFDPHRELGETPHLGIRKDGPRRFLVSERAGHRPAVSDGLDRRAPCAGPPARPSSTSSCQRGTGPARRCRRPPPRRGRTIPRSRSGPRDPSTGRS